ncbi:MAG: hypothetical protein CL608_29850 [Anaerolineaceae bacterium]|nr:hypothetical protein [Anaerolineaceae bacterium]
MSDVCRKSKNELFRMMYENGCGGAVLKDGCALIRAARRPNAQRSQEVCTPDHVLQSILDDAVSAAVSAARASTPESRKVINPTIRKNSNSAARKCIIPKDKPARKSDKKPVKKPAKKPAKKPCVT